MRALILIFLLLLSAGPFVARAEELPPPVAKTVGERRGALEEIARWRLAALRESDRLLLRRLDGLESDEQDGGLATVRAVRRKLESGGIPVLSDTHGGPASLRQAIALHMEERHETEREASARAAKARQGLLEDLNRLAAEFEAEGKSGEARLCRAQAAIWDEARIRSILLAARAPDPAAETTAPAGATVSTAPPPGGGETRVGISPVPPVRLAPGEGLRLVVSYQHARLGRARIQVRPLFDGIGVRASSEGASVFGQGGGRVEITVRSHTPGRLTSLYARMIDAETGEMLAETLLPVEVAWE